jgi:hypothetical protein
MRAFRLLLLAVLLCSMFGASAQSPVPLERNRMLYLENYFDRNSVNVHTDIRPFVTDATFDLKVADSMLVPGSKPYTTKRSWFIRKVFYEHFLKTDTSNFYIAADPLLDLVMGYDMHDKGLTYSNGRGIQIIGGVGNKLAFYTSYLESQSRFSSYINEFVRHYEVVPGMNRVKDFKGTSFDYGLATANVSYSPWKFLNIQIGYGKNFFGNGYRSLLLSDNAFNYPFLKISTRLGRFEYVNLFTSFQNLDTDSVLDAPKIWYNGYQKKGGTFNYLSVKATDWLQIGLFEGVIWKSRALKDHAFNINQFIPVILLNTIRYSLFSENNVVLGLNTDVRVRKGYHVYGQFVLDDLHFKKPASGKGYQKTKYGYQIGVKAMDFVGLKNLMIQMEYNEVRPYTYGHQDALQSYTHNNQALAHPLGANFRELMMIANYRYKRIYAELQAMLAYTGGDDSTSHWGSNIFYSDTRGSRGYNSFGNTTLQGIERHISCTGAKLGYLFNPRYHLCVEGGVWLRNAGGDAGIKSNLGIWLGLKTTLFNQYFDW